MKKLVIALCSIGLLGMGLASTAYAQLAPQDNMPAKGTAHPKIQQQLSALNLDVKAVANAPIDGLLQVFTNRGLFFTSEDGRFFIEGNIYDLANQVLVNDAAMRPFIQQQTRAMASKAIEYKAKDEKYVVTVFTDPSCGYCRKLHNEMSSYHDAGITVRYLAYPRGGLGSPTYLQMQHIWCSKDSRSAMDQAKGDGKVKPAMCDNPVKEQFELGQSFGISGTPAMILPSGRLIPGYQPAQALLAQLKAEEEKQAQ